MYTMYLSGFYLIRGAGMALCRLTSFTVGVEMDVGRIAVVVANSVWLSAGREKERTIYSCETILIGNDEI